MRKTFIALGVLVIILAIAVLTAPSLIDVNRYRPQIEAKLRDRLGRDVSLGPMKLSLIPLAFRVENAVIGEDPAFKTGRPFAQVQTLFLSPELLPLLHREVQIKSVQLGRPSVELVRNEQGTWNFSNLLARNQTQKPQAFSLDKLKLYDGQIALTDLQQRKPRAVYDHIDLLVYDFVPGKAFSFDASAHLPGAGKQALVVQGKAGPVDGDGVFKTPFDGTLKLTEVSLSQLQRFMNVAQLSDSDAVLTGSADLKNNAGMFNSKGKFEARNPRLRGMDVGYPIMVDYDVTSDVNQSTYQIQKADLKLGQTPMSFRGKINAEPTPMQADLTVQTSNAPIAELARLAAVFGVAFNDKTNVGGILNLNVHAQGPVNKPVLNGQIAARNLRISGGELREPVQVDAVEVSLSPDTIRSNEFTAKTGRTSAAAQVTVSQYASDAPRLDAKLNTENAKLEELLRIGHAYGISAVDGMSGSGSVTLNVNVSGPIKQVDQLTYSGGGAFRQVSLNFPSVAKPLEVRNAELRFNGNSVFLNNLDFSIGQTTAHGNVTAHNLAAPEVQFTLAANLINVSEWEQMIKARPRQGTQSRPPVAEEKGSSQDRLVNRISGSGLLTAEKIVLDEFTLNNARSTVTLDHGIITLKPLTAGLFNGQEEGTIVVNTRTEPTTYTVDSRLQGVDANQLLSAISPVKQTLYGVLSANADTRFTTTAGAASILPSLNGKVSLKLNNGKIANVDLLHQLASIAQFQTTAKAVEPFTQLIQLTGDFDIRNGVARTNNLKAVIDAGSLAASGIVDLAQQKLDLHVTTVLSQDYSQAVGGTGIGGFLNTALANNKGELVVPVLVTGTFQHPVFAPDLQKVAQMKLQNLVPNINDPAALTNSIFGQIFQGKPAPGGLGDILGPLGGKQQQQQQQQQPPQPQEPNQMQQPEKKQEPQPAPDTLQDLLNSVFGNKKKQ
jgi:AsmA protein